MKILPILYLIGQLLEVSGAIMLFLYAVPKHVLTNSVWGNEGDKEARPQKEADNKRFRKLSRVGLGLILFGFVIQLPVSINNCCNAPTGNVTIGNCISDCKTK